MRKCDFAEFTPAWSISVFFGLPIKFESKVRYLNRAQNFSLNKMGRAITAQPTSMSTKTYFSIITGQLSSGLVKLRGFTWNVAERSFGLPWDTNLFTAKV